MGKSGEGLRLGDPSKPLTSLPAVHSYVLALIFSRLQPRSSLPTEKRPTQIHDWMKRKRILARPPAIPQIELYAAQWQDWWSRMQPDWRRGPDGLLRDRDGPWDKLAVPGQNGMFIVLVSLSWWRAIALESGLTLETCDECTQDVRWVLRKIAAASPTPILTGYVHYMTIYSTATILTPPPSKRGPDSTPREKPAKCARRG